MQPNLKSWQRLLNRLRPLICISSFRIKALTVVSGLWLLIYVGHSNIRAVASKSELRPLIYADNLKSGLRHFIKKKIVDSIKILWKTLFSMWGLGTRHKSKYTSDHRKRGSSEIQTVFSKYRPFLKNGSFP